MADNMSLVAERPNVQWIPKFSAEWLLEPAFPVCCIPISYPININVIDLIKHNDEGYLKFYCTTKCEFSL